MNPSSPNHHRQTTRPVTGAGSSRHYVEAQTGWGIANFACAIRCYQILMIKADNQTRNSAGPLPDDLRHALIKIRADVRTDTKFGDSERVTTDQPHAAGYAVAASGVSVTV